MSGAEKLAKKCKGFVAVHIGAGYHSPANSELYKQVCKQACMQAIQLLRDKKSALEAVTAAVVALENSEWTNAGIGSNLSLAGTVECDASLMDGRSSHYGAVGALSGVKNPILVAESLLRTQMQGELSLGRIPPSMVVAHGAYDWALKHSIETIPNQDLVTESSRKTYIKNKRKLEIFEEGLQNDAQNGKKYRRLDGGSRQEIMNGADATALNDNVDGMQFNMTSSCVAAENDTSGTAAASSEPEMTLKEQDLGTSEMSKDGSRSANDYIHHVAVNEMMADVQRLDTVGAICVDDDGWIASAVSSGGIILKQPGRLGQAALYGCGCWAENDLKGDVGIGVSTSGCGEQLSKTIFARTCADSLKGQDNSTRALHSCFTDKFLKSPHMRHERQPLGGAVVVTVDSSSSSGELEDYEDEGGKVKRVSGERRTNTDQLSVEVLWAHTTDSMCLSFMSTQDHQAKALVSRLPPGTRAGKSVVVQSKFYSISGSSS